MTTGQIPNWFVVVMGLGTVFVGLICIIGILLVMGWVVQRTAVSTAASVNKPAAVKSSPAVEMSPQEHQQLVAAVSAAIAENLGTDISAIRICSMKKVS